jgi:hypothetical protein
MPETMSPLRCNVTVGLEQVSGAGDGAAAGGGVLVFKNVKAVSRTLEVADTSGTKVSDMM